MQWGREWVSVLTQCAHTIIIMPKKPAQMNGEMRLRRNGKGEHPHIYIQKAFLHDAQSLPLMRGWSWVIHITLPPQLLRGTRGAYTHRCICYVCHVQRWAPAATPFLMPRLAKLNEIMFSASCCCHDGVRLRETPPRRTCTGVIGLRRV